MKSFIQYFNENMTVIDLSRLLDQIDQTLDQSSADEQEFSDEEIDHLASKIGEVYDMVMNSGKSLPDHMQGSAGVAPRHISTLRKLKSRGAVAVPEHVINQIDEMLRLYTEADAEKKSNPFEKPEWAKQRDLKQADDQKKAVMSAFSKPKTDTDDSEKSDKKQFAKR